jgi:hypothetical protein
MTLSEVLTELEQAATLLGDDARLDDDELLDLAVLALALQCPELWRGCVLIPRRPTHAMS